VDNILFTQNILSIYEFSTERFSVSPNPTSSTWNINSNRQIIKTILIFDILGKQVVRVIPNSNQATIDASSLKDGIYMAKIEGENGTRTVKLVKN
ncbi:MAG: T9SS type A sorting domain-containing protein, partial [Winogradskyella sp.]|nr:T9SS type A sorting domain-containing protein [Winogradskyella sp.]